VSAFIIDTETTGIIDPEVIEFAYMPLEGGHVTQQRYRPSKPITFGAMATHHICHEDLMDCEPSSQCRLPDEATHIIGHNVDFDWAALGKPAGVKRICTLAIARACWPACDSHRLGALMYMIQGPAARDQVLKAHGAAGP
jgi:exodeoxyribonuclease X